MIKRKQCSAIQWDDEMTGSFNRHVLQSPAWMAFKVCTGWQAQYLLWYDKTDRLIGGAAVLEKISHLPVLPGSLKIMYCPRGPVMAWHDPAIVKAVLTDLVDFAREQQAVYIKIDPECYYPLETEEPIKLVENQLTATNLLQESGWRCAREQIQFRNTFWLSLQKDEETLLAQMKQKTRYNIRLAEKKNVKVRLAAPQDFKLLYRMYMETSRRDGFIIRSEAYYLALWQQFYEKKKAYGLIAEYEGEPLAGLILFVYDQRSWYFYGMSTEKHRNLMPTYLLQWEAIKLSKKLNCTIYDLWGAPEEISTEDAMFGVYRFKQGLGAALVQGMGAWDYVYKPFWYQCISIVLPGILGIMRRIRRARIHQEVTKS
jgi:lipid II:glycine glycyltransferase (peptidoglycan interpeptide bridge formation enzyme)